MRRGFESLMVGRVLAGRYEVREPVARGGMSVVFRALDRTLGREVAVKVVSLAGVAPEDVLPVVRERFRREAASAARIQHANVVQVFDYGTDPELELDFIVMELLRGRDLKQALAAGPLPPAEGLRIVRDAARGVAAGHRAGLVHRDVKPANVFLLGEGEVEAVKVLDFGIAKPLEEDPDGGLTVAGTMPHSPAYASPEQLAPDLPVSLASDVYQLGLLAYEVLAGRRAFTPDERDRIRAGERVPLARTDAWAAVPLPVREVVERALDPAPAERHADAAEFVEALARAEAAPADDDHTVLAPPESERPASDPTALLAASAGVPVAPPPSPRPVPPSRRSLPRAPVLWVVPLLLLLALAVWAARRGGAEPAATAALPDSAALAAADDEFLRLQGEAGAAADTGPETPAPGSSGARAEAEGEIVAAVHDLNRAWVEGEIRRHVAHYASRVDYYNSRRLPRSGVRRDRTRDLNRYDDRRIGIHDVEVEWLEDDRARVLVDKEWFFGGDGRTRQGRGVQEYVFKRDGGDGRWYVVSEQLLTTTEERSGVEGG
jgi:serine/threonine protein kinase